MRDLFPFRHYGATPTWTIAASSTINLDQLVGSFVRRTEDGRVLAHCEIAFDDHSLSVGADDTFVLFAEVIKVTGLEVHGLLLVQRRFDCREQAEVAQPG